MPNIVQQGNYMRKMIGVLHSVC